MNMLNKWIFFLPAFLMTGIISVSGQDCPNITGHVTYRNAQSSPVPLATVKLIDQSDQLLQTTLTNHLGHYSFCQTEPGTYSIEVESLAEAGGMNATDAQVALQHFVGLLNLSGMELLAADVTAGGYVNTADALLILKKYTGLISSFPQGDWLFETGSCTIVQGGSAVVNITGLCYGDLNASFQPEPCSPMPAQADAGPDQTITGNSCLLAGNIPPAGSGSWQIVSGNGGVVEESENPASAFNGLTGTTYMLTWTITTPCTFTVDTVIIELSQFTCGAPFTDARDNRIYNTVQIGTQCWMKENLNVGIMVTDHTTDIPHTHASNNGIVEKYCYNNDPAMCEIYGGLYDWNEMMQYSTTEGIQGICPDGWHLSTDGEWCTLVTFLYPSLVSCGAWGAESTQAGGKMKESGTAHWMAPNTGATNESGFTAFAGGMRIPGGYFGLMGGNGFFWSSTQYSGTEAIRRNLYTSGAGTNRYRETKLHGLSVRCVRN